MTSRTARISATRVAAMVRAVLVAALWIALALSALKVTHDFYQYIDRSIHVTVDDSEANIAYAIATEGRYGFFASPVLVGMDRTRGQFNYGPWYFYLAGGLVWLYGFSVTLVRSIHLWVILLSIVGAASWFGGRHRIVAVAIYGLGILYCFDASHWPMARPDILVSAFALVFVASAGLAWRQPKAIYWFCAGLAATCGAFTHLIAASLLPTAALVFVLASWLGTGESRADWRRHTRMALALGAGVAVGLTMFYGSFGFGFSTQWQFFTAYRELTATKVTYPEVLANHLGYAFGYLSPAARFGVWVTLATAWLSVFGAFCLNRERRDLLQARLVPPLVVWSAYLASNLFYPNYHQGYAILHQVMFLWLAAALAWTALELITAASAKAGSAVTVLAMAALLVVANQQLNWQFSNSSWKLVRAATWASFTEYSERVLQTIPARSTAWGSIVFGMETPGRVQLVQWADAASLFPKVPASERDELTPEFIIFSYSEARDNVLSVMSGDETLLDRTAERLAGVPYRVVSLVAAAPYGVTRTYARVASRRTSPSAPTVHIYDPDRRRWLTRVGNPMAAEFAAVPPVALKIGYQPEPRESLARGSVVADLPSGRYMLKVAITPGQGRSPRRMIAATSASMLRQTIGEMGPDGDFTAYLDGETEAYLAIAHTGGPLYVSQYDDGVEPGIAGVTAFPMLGLLDADELPSRELDLPPLAGWNATSGVVVTPAAETIRVEGNTTANGYQVSSPQIRIHEHNRVTVRLPSRIESGSVCTGVLNGDDSSWLLAPTPSREDLQFVIDATQGFRIVVANCNARPGASGSRFIIWPGTYLVEPIGAFYADRLIAAALHPESLNESEPADLSVRTFPAALRVTKAEAEGPVAELQESDFSYRASIVRREAAGWVVAGRAEGQFSYLLQSNERPLARGQKVLVAGRLDRGGLSIGLLTDNKWVGQIHINEPGEFTVVLAPPASGRYSVVVANNITRPEDLESAVVLSRVGLVDQ